MSEGIVDPGFSLLNIPQPESFAWRIGPDGLLQRLNGFNNWSNATPYMGLNQLFNDYDIASNADVQAAIEAVAITVPDIVSALTEYGGQYGTTGAFFTGPHLGTNGLFSSNTASVADAIGQGFLGFTQMFRGSVTSSNFVTQSYVSGNTSAVLDTYDNFWAALNGHLRAIERGNVLLTGNRYLSSSGNSVTDSVLVSTPYILGSGFVGLSTNLTGGSTQNYNRRTTGAGERTQTTVSNLLQIQRLGFQDVLDGMFLSIGSGYLGSSGVRVTDQVYVGMPFILGSGFLGLSNNLTGGSSQTYTRWTIGSTEQTQTSVNNLMQLTRLGFTDIMSAMSTPVGTNMLNSTGITAATQTRNSLAAISSYGFAGLATVLRGSSGNVATIESLDWSQASGGVLAPGDKLESGNVLDLLALGFTKLQNDFAYYLYSHGTDMDITIRDNMQEQADSFVEDFTSPGGKGTPSNDNVNDTSGISDSLGSNFDTGATAADAFTQLGDGSNWLFFSSQVASEIEPGSMTRGYSDDGFVSVFDDHYNQIIEGLGSLW